MTTTFLDRAGWGGGPVASGHLVPETQFVGLVEHHTVIVLPDYDHDGMTAGDLDDAIRYMQQLKVARPDLGPDVPYSFVTFEGATPNDCIVAEGRGRGITGAHTIGYNSTRYGCAWAGDYTSHSPTPGMYEGLRWIGRTMLVDPAHAVPTLQHRDVYQTACPGASSVAPSPAQPPFDPIIITPEEDMRFTYMIRQGTIGVVAHFDSGRNVKIHSPEMGFTTFEDVYVTTLGCEFRPDPFPAGYHETRTIDDGTGQLRLVTVVGPGTADAIGLP